MAGSRDLVDVYPVGVLAPLLFIRNAARRRHSGGVRFGLRRLRGEARYITARARDGNWRAVKNCFNGYLAEPRKWPEDGSLRRCGSGWTKKRAMRSLYRHGWNPEGTV